MLTQGSHNHTGNITDFKSTGELRGHHFNLSDEKSREIVAQRRVQSTCDLNPTYFFLFTYVKFCFFKTLIQYVNAYIQNL